ncbi:MAG: AAA family ATPase [Desulfamplus sp.]|nr:AAA family ATPase [Desulfamplus sp.]
MVPFIILNDVMRNDYKKRMIERSLSYIKKASTSGKQMLYDAITNAKLRMKGGFRDIRKTPIEILYSPVIEAASKDNSIMGAVLNLWVESQSELRTTMKDFLFLIGVSVEEISDWTEGFSKTCSNDKAFQISNEFANKNPKFDIDDIVLMFWCLTGKACIAEEETKDSKMFLLNSAKIESEQCKVDINDKNDISNIESLFLSWLDTLKDLPPEAPEWENMPFFIEKITTLTSKKLVERKKQEQLHERQMLLQASIEALKDQASEFQEYFGLQNIALWNSNSYIDDNYDNVLNMIQLLREQILNFKKISQYSKRSFIEEKVIGDEIVSIYNQLDCLLVRTESNYIAEELNESLTQEEKKIDKSFSVNDSDEHICSKKNSEYLPKSELSDIHTEYDNTNIEVYTDSSLLKTNEETVLINSKQADIQYEAGLEKINIKKESSMPDHSYNLVLSENSWEEKEWNELLSNFICENDISGAYWLSKSLAVSEVKTFVPDWMLKGILAAQWLSHDFLFFVDDLLDIAKNHQPESNDIQVMIGLSVAMTSTLIAPVTGLVDWLKVPKCCSSFSPLVKAILEFNKLSIALHPEDLLGVAGKEQREIALVKQVAKVKNWYDGAFSRRTTFRMAADVWRYILDKGDLSTAIKIVIQDQRNKSDYVRQTIDKWIVHEYAVEQFDYISRQLKGFKAPTIVGTPRQHLLNGINEACIIVREWCELVMREKDIESRGDWLFNQIKNLRNDIQEHIIDIETTLNELLCSNSHEYRAAATTMVYSVWKLEDILQIQKSNFNSISSYDKKWEWLKNITSNSRKIKDSINRRLLYIPDIELDKNCEPEEEELCKIQGALKAGFINKLSLDIIIDKWFEKQDYSFVKDLILQFEDDRLESEKNQRYYELLKGSQYTLIEQLTETTTAMEQAVVDGIISDSEGRSEYAAKIDSINVDEVLNFLPKFQILSNIRKDLTIARQNRINQLKDDWIVIKERLATSHIDSELYNTVVNFINITMESNNTGVVEESLAHLKEVLDRGIELEKRLFTDSSSQEERDALVDFKSLWNQIEEWLNTPGRALKTVAEEILEGRTHASMKFGEIPKKRREEANISILAWQKLKQHKTKINAEEFVKSILCYMGFSFGLDNSKDIIKKINGGSDWIYFKSYMSISDLAKPIPQFGSQAGGQYDIICLWERPGVDSIAARIRELNLNIGSVIVLYLGRMTERQRRDMSRICKEKELTIAILDEILLIFLAYERDARFPIFLHCALPFTALNPYTPFQAGDVPTEMFFGRNTMLTELQRAAGSCLVYGGRQLGKSALLRHVQRLFDNPNREQYAWIENTKLIFDPQAGKGTNNIWNALKQAFISKKIFSNRKTSDKPEAIQNYIREAMEIQGRRVIVMFDEADDFLDADASDNFRVVTAIREVMLATERRFKVIFAGLHNVQRFQGIPDQPLAHFGAPLCVGPLEPAAARQLVIKPLAILGYRLNNSTVLRILSYTNYHPGLIQFFCQEILKRLHNNPKNALPPHEIQQSDVEAVYRIQEVRERIKERFDWTLALDIRYQAIAWGMIENQFQIKDSYALPYIPADILYIASSWWPQGFINVNIDKIRSLLDEMCGLGVLVRNRDGRYRLRSPNLVRLMGTETDIYGRLQELLDKQPPTPFTADSYHAHIDDKAKYYSPLTHAQARSLNFHKFGVCMIFASDAIGFPYIQQSLNRFFNPDSIDIELCTEIPDNIVEQSSFSKWIINYMSSKPQHESLAVYIKMGDYSSNTQHSLVKEALEFCYRHHKSRKQWLKFIFLFNSIGTWRWLSLPYKTKEIIENEVHTLVIPRRWDIIAIRQRLEQHQKIHSEVICNRIAEVTGGWQFLLDQLFQLSTKKDDPTADINKIEYELLKPQSKLGLEFYSLMGIEHSPCILKVLQFIIHESEVPIDLIGEVDLIPSVNTDECKQSVEYLLRMNCLELKDNILYVEPTIKRVIEKQC